MKVGVGCKVEKIWRGGMVEFVGIADIHGGFQVRYLTKSKKYAEKAPRLCASVRCFGNRTF